MKTKKWLILAALLVAVFASAVTAGAVKDAYCIRSGRVGEQVAWELDSHGLLVITGAGEIKANQYDYRKLFFNKVIIEPGVTGMGYDAFSGCKMRQITIADTVTIIDSSAFYGCQQLEELVIPDSVTWIGWYAFQYMTSLKHIQLPKNITEISPYTFDSCSSLATIVIPEGVTSIGHDALANCTNLQAIVLPSTLQTIDEDAFLNCDNLWHIFYTGTEEQWNQIRIVEKGNETFRSIAPHFHCTGSELRQQVVEEASCTETGKQKLGCGICQEAKVIDISLRPHQYQYACHGLCVNCGSTEGADHHWKDVITKSPTCKEEGIKTISCRYCEEFTEEAVEKDPMHTYDNKCDNACNIFGHTRDRSHKWDQGVVTKEPTCGEEGILTSTCENCQQTKEEAIPMLTDHTFDHDCDTDCNICGLTRETTHVPGPPATATSDQICTVCSVVLETALGETVPTVPTEPSQPTEPSKPAPTAPTTAPTSPTAPDDPIEQQANPGTAVLVIAIICATIGIGIVLILISRKKK